MFKNKDLVNEMTVENGTLKAEVSRLSGLVKSKDELITSYRKEIDLLTSKLERYENSFNVKLESIVNMLLNNNFVKDTFDKNLEIVEKESVNEDIVPSTLGLEDGLISPNADAKDFLQDLKKGTVVEFTDNSLTFMDLDSIKKLGFKTTKLYKFKRMEKRMTTDKVEYSLYAVNFSLSFGNNKPMFCRMYLYATKENVKLRFEKLLKEALVKYLDVQVSKTAKGDVDGCWQSTLNDFVSCVEGNTGELDLIFDFIRGR